LDDYRTQVDGATALDRHRDVRLQREVSRGSDRAAVHDHEAVDLRGDDLHRDPMSLLASMTVIDHQPVPIRDRRRNAVRCSLQHRDLLAGSVPQDHLAAIPEGDRPELSDRDHGLSLARGRQGKQKR
jgi:hypothetical protein